jgi:tRNA (adenine57-N1/adenine58-N1)-methyltransferase
VRNTAGVEYLALRPLLADYVLSMPRGAAVVYPKDAGQIVAMADVFPGARVVEAGVGSGALTMSLLRAVGDAGSVHSFERRADFADIARANVETFFGGPHPAWRLTVGDLVESLPANLVEPVDRVVLDMLAPVGVPGRRRRRPPARRRPDLLRRYGHPALPGRRGDARGTAPGPSRPGGSRWSAAGTSRGLAVRPQHRMVGHTGFLITSRRMADGVLAPPRRRRPAGSTRDGGEEVEQAWGEWTSEDLGERPVSEKKIRRVRRDVTATAAPGRRHGPGRGGLRPDRPGRCMTSWAGRGRARRRADGQGAGRRRTSRALGHGSWARPPPAELRSTRPTVVTGGAFDDRARRCERLGGRRPA